MKLIIQKSLSLNGKVFVPSSKSQTIRAIFFALLANGHSQLSNTLNADDIEDALTACRALGTAIQLDQKGMTIASKGVPIASNVSLLHTGNSGITTRFILPLLGLRENPLQPIILDCGLQMRARPIHSLVNALRELGMNIQYQQGPNTLPLMISGPLVGGTTEISGLTSQYLSALLISLPCAPEDSQIRVKNLHERPYMEMTLNWLDEQKIQYNHYSEKNYDIYRIPGRQRYRPFNATIEGDFSSASYLIAAGALLGGTIELLGLNIKSPQGDKQLIRILQAMGANIHINSSSLVIQGGAPLTGMVIDGNSVPDLLPTLAVLGCFAKGKTEIRNVPQARIKETDRIHSMTEGLRRLGAKVDEHKDGLTVYPSFLRGALLRGYDDHRTVMALAIAGIMAEGQTIIEGAEAIHKTFPTFITLIQSLGVQVEVKE